MSTSMFGGNIEPLVEDIVRGRPGKRALNLDNPVDVGACVLLVETLREAVDRASYYILKFSEDNTKIKKTQLSGL